MNRPCPWCKTAEQLVIGTTAMNGESAVYMWVQCDRCGARGPWRLNPVFPQPTIEKSTSYQRGMESQSWADWNKA